MAHGNLQQRSNPNRYPNLNLNLNAHTNANGKANARANGNANGIGELELELKLKLATLLPRSGHRRGLSASRRVIHLKYLKIGKERNDKNKNKIVTNLWPALPALISQNTGCRGYAHRGSCSSAVYSFSINCKGIIYDVKLLTKTY